MLITSRDNSCIRHYRHLLNDGKFRRETGRFVVEGARLCEDAARSHIVIEAAFYTQAALSRYPTQLSVVKDSAQVIYEITDALAAYISDTKAPQGLFCICIIPDQEQPNLSKDGRYAALERIQDPSNLGTMIRTAEALGLNGLLLSDGCCDPYNPKVLRGSMGGVFRLPLYFCGDFCDTLSRLSNNGFVTVACVVDETVAPVQSLSMGRGTIVVIGNEGNGLKPETVRACSICTTIPMLGRAESLNASMAAGIVFWEMMRGEHRD